MSADVALLRRAASLMRERAETATPGPFSVIDAGGWWTVEGLERFRHLTNDVGFGEDRATAVHVASWHPAVALAVADLLDRIAWMGGLDPDLLHRVGMAEVVAIARAYLGEATA